MPELLDIVGQDEALAQVQQALHSGRRPHAFLFVGPEGVGRETTALQLAKLLLCERPAEKPNKGRLAELPGDFPLLVPCNRCPSCQTANAGTNPNLILVFKELARYHEDPSVRKRKMQELGIPVIQKFLIAPAHMTSFGGHGRAFIVREAELMSVEAQNALLKTLEEPPSGVTLILLATSEQELLPTTRSRCRIVRFHPLPLDFVAKRLQEAGVKTEEANFWAAMTGGSLGQSLQASQSELFAFKRELVKSLAELSESSSPQLAEMLVKAMNEQAERLGKAGDSKRESPRVKAKPAEDEEEEEGEEANLAASLANRLAGQTILSILVSVYRDALRLATGQHGRLIHADQAALVEKLARRGSPSQLADVLSQLASYEEVLWRNVNIKLLWDNVALTCAGAPAM